MNVRALAIIVVALPCLASGAGAEDVVRISGTGASIGGMKLLAEAFAKAQPGMRIEVLPSTGTTGGIRAVADGQLQLACASRPFNPDERNQGLVEELYAKTAFIFAAQASQQVEGLSLREIEDIYAGKRTTWPDGRPIRPVLRPATDAFTLYLLTFTPGMRAAVEAARKIPGLFVGITDQDAADQIEKTPGSFGTTSAALVASEKRRIKAFAVDGVLPTDANVASGKYPYTLPLYLVWRDGQKVGATKAFIDFIYSKEGERILSENGHSVVVTSHRP